MATGKADGSHQLSYIECWGDTYFETTIAVSTILVSQNPIEK